MLKSQWGLFFARLKLSFNSLKYFISPPFGNRDDLIFRVNQRVISTYCSAKCQIVARLRRQDSLFCPVRGLARTGKTAFLSCRECDSIVQEYYFAQPTPLNELLDWI